MRLRERTGRYLYNDLCVLYRGKVILLGDIQKNDEKRNSILPNKIPSLIKNVFFCSHRHVSHTG